MQRRGALDAACAMQQGAHMSDRQTRRRGVALEQVILEAAWQELSERGWAGFTIEGIAARSGAAKTVIYRRWRNRVDLAQDMLQRASTASQQPFPSSGSLRTDLVAFLARMAAFLNTPFGEAARGVICGGDPTTQPSVFGDEPIVAEINELINQAIARGELKDRPRPVAMNLGHALVMSEFLHTGSPPSRADVEELVDNAWLPALGLGA